LPKSDTPYTEIFRQHRVLLSAPVVIALFISLWTVVGAQKQYQSTASLWFDNAPPAQSSVTQTDPTVRPPAAQEQLVLNELVATRDFRLSVGHNGPLAGFLARNNTDGKGPTALLKRLGAKASIDSRILSALSAKHVSATVVGPQVLSVSLSAPSPDLATGTLKALLAEFSKQQNATRLANAKAASSYYTDLVNSANQAAQAADSKVTGYMAAHPGVTASDPNLAALTQTATAADAKLADANNNLSQATVNLAHQSDTTAMQTLDAPSVGTAVTGGKKKDLLALVAGLFAGALISILGMVIIAGRRKKASSGGVDSVDDAPAPPSLQPAEPRPSTPVAPRAAAQPSEPRPNTPVPSRAAPPPAGPRLPASAVSRPSASESPSSSPRPSSFESAHPNHNGNGSSRSGFTVTHRRPSTDPRREPDR
jgi:hypothetical protein